MQGGIAVEYRKERELETNRNDRLDTGLAFAAVHSQATAQASKTDEEKMSLFWRVFGGTILSICALIGITVYNNMAGNISELRSEISRINEARSELIKKDEFNTRLTQSGTQLQSLQTLNNSQNATLTSVQTAISELKDRLVTAKADSDTLRKEALLSADAIKKEEAKALDAIKKDQALFYDSVKKDLVTLEALKERITHVESLKKDIDSLRKDLTSLESIKEKITVITTDMKSAREDVVKLRQDVERNQASDEERKKSRDDQYTKLLDTIKDFDKSLRSCGEKIARLEGAVSPMPPEKAPPKPAENPKSGEGTKPNGGSKSGKS
ncbi:MAG: hypothetical protein U0798_10420 [Gemmataceae bacterium]